METIDAWAISGLSLGTETEPIRVTSALVTGTMLSTIGVSPITGRLITPDPTNAPLQLLQLPRSSIRSISISPRF